MSEKEFNEHLLDDVPGLDGIEGKPPQSLQDALGDAAEDSSLDFKPEHLQEVNFALAIANSKIPFALFTPEYTVMAISKAFRIGRAYQRIVSKSKPK